MKASAIVPARSAVLRGPVERAVLDLLTARLAAVSLAGYIFFGSSVNISDQARSCASHVCVPSRVSTAGGLSVLQRLKVARIGLAQSKVSKLRQRRKHHAKFGQLLSKIQGAGTAEAHAVLVSGRDAAPACCR